jgi:cytochrome c oxidase cbb3-type subunit 3/ubiquinol-cytochrome c reductase cytochrome c subunit
MSDEEILDILTFLRQNGPAQISLPMTPVKGDAGRGQTVYDAECTRCHGTPAERGEAPHLSNIELLQAASDSFLRYTIVHGRKGTKMEPFEGKLSDEQIDDVVSLLRSWVPAPPPRPTAEPVNIPEDLPVVLNPKGSAPVFTLRDEKFVPAEQVNQALKDKKKIVILDARSPAEWARLRIPGALPTPHYEKARLDVIPNDDTWVVAYCACPHHASGEVVDELRRRGHANAVILDEGILVWQQKGYPIAREAATAGSASASASARAPGAASAVKPKPVERNTIPFGPPPF